MSLVLTERQYTNALEIQEVISAGQSPLGIDNPKDISQDKLKCAVVSEVTVPTKTKRKRSKRRSQKNGWSRRKKTQKREESPIPDWMLEQDENAIIPDLRKRLPFTHCKIVLGFEDDEEKGKKGWVKEGSMFVFNEFISLREKKKFASYIWEPVSPRPRRSSKSKTGNVKNPAADKECQQPFPAHAEETKSAEIIEGMGASKSRQSAEIEGHDQIVKCQLPSPVNPPLSKDEAKAVIANFWPIYNCPYCHATFSHSAASISHLRQHRTGLKTVIEHLILPHPIDKDDRATESSIKMGVQNKIGKGFKCSVCLRHFRSIQGLLIHEGYIHKGYRKEGKLICNSNTDTDTVGVITGLSRNKDGSIAHPRNNNLTQTKSLPCEESSKRGKSSKNNIHKRKSTQGSNAAIAERSQSENLLIKKNIEEIPTTVNNQPLHTFRDGLREKRFPLLRNANCRIESFHRKGVRRFNSTKCPKLFYNNSHLQRDIHVNSGLQPFTCTFCPKTFSGREKLNAHLTTHRGIKPHKCSLRPKAFLHRKYLTRHSKTHNGIKSHKCNLCPKAFLHKRNLDAHLVTHTGIKSHKCSLCLKAFFHRKSLTRHLKTHTENKSHKCSLCPKAYFRKEQLDSHLVIHSGIKSFKCSLCPKAYFRKKQLNIHFVVHSGIKSHKCSLCLKAFLQKANLNRHLKTHTGIKPHKCSLCSKAFLHKRNLDDHLVTHTGIKSHKCSLCLKTFFHRRSLTRHLKTHTEIKSDTHKCSLCPKAYFRKEQLDSHLVIHSGIKSFKCSLCPKAYFRKKQLNIHFVVHSGIKPHKCSLCPKAFIQKAHLIRHLMTHGKLAPQNSFKAKSN